jgi:hypothetical protein
MTYQHKTAAAVALERHLKRMAVQIASQLPEDESEALAILDYTRELLTGYLRPSDTGLHLVRADD